MRLAQKRRQHADEQQQHQPRRGPREREREDHGRDHLQDEPAHLLDHGQAVGRLHAGAFEAIVEDGVLVRRQVELRRLVHHAHAHVLRVAVREQRVRVVDAARDQTQADVQHHLGADQRPEVDRIASPEEVDRLGRERPVRQHRRDAVHNVLRDLGDQKRRGRRDDPEHKPPAHRGPARLPQDAQHRRDVPERAQPVQPRVVVGHRTSQPMERTAAASPSAPQRRTPLILGSRRGMHLPPNSWTQTGRDLGRNLNMAVLDAMS